ncbi:uncharacterized protein LOC111273893 [Varroa jacobsoni]|uniref:uncharacterized protein LOC111273893 n=1 Tax=Varroa jacobsoni TaxID=62625 RepID=UPI000BF4BB7C|nr:uncharacterized protein LOC111273893 [Varroa jacobsoni]
MLNRDSVLMYFVFLSEICFGAGYDVDQSDGLRNIYGSFLDVFYNLRSPAYRGSDEVRSSNVSVIQNNNPAKRQSALVRVRRSERLLCLANDFATNFFSRLIEANEKNLRDWEPIDIGDGANIGILDLRRGKAYGVANIFLQGKVNTNCAIDKDYVSLELPVGVRDTRIVYDYTVPLALYMIGGQIEIGFSLLGVNATLYVARKRKSGLKPYLKRVVVWSIRGFNMKLNGAGPATAALGIGFNLLAKVFPIVIEQFLASLFVLISEKFLATANLPI